MKEVCKKGEIGGHRRKSVVEEEGERKGCAVLDYENMKEKGKLI